MQNKQKQQKCKNTVRLPMFSALVEAGPDTVSDCKVMSTGCLERSGRRGEGGGRMKTTARPILESEGGGGGWRVTSPQGLEMDKASLIQTHKTSVLVSSSCLIIRQTSTLTKHSPALTHLNLFYICLFAH